MGEKVRWCKGVVEMRGLGITKYHETVLIVTLSAADVTDKAAIALNSGSSWNRAGPQSLLLTQSLPSSYLNI